MSFSLFGPSPFSEKCGRWRHDAFQQWLQRHLYHCPTRSDVNAVACATDMPREREAGKEGVGGHLFARLESAAMHSPESLRVRPPPQTSGAPVGRRGNGRTRTNDERASFFLLSPFLSSFSFGRKSQIGKVACQGLQHRIGNATFSELGLVECFLISN